MAFTVKNRIKQTSTTNGTTNVVMTGSVSGFQTFGNALSDGDTTYYAIVDPANGTWEVGLGTWANGSSTLTRTTILESSSGSSAIDFSGSVSKDVFVTEPASKSLIEGSSAISNAEFLKKNGSVIEGRSASEVRSDLGLGSLALLSQVAQPSMALNTVNEAILQVSNTPTNNYFLQAQSGNTGGLTWAEVDLSSYLTSSTASSTYAPLSGASFTSAVAVNSGTTNTVATFTSTDSVAGIQLVDSSGVSEITTEGTTFQVRPNGGVAKLSVGTSGANFADTVSAPAFDFTSTGGAIYFGSGTDDYLYLQDVGTSGNSLAFVQDSSTKFSMQGTTGNATFAGTVTASGFSGKIHPVNGTTTNYLSLKDSNELNFFNSGGTSQTLHINYDGGNVGLGGNAVTVSHNGNTVFGSAIGATYMYDVSNSSYYVDPSSNSKLYSTNIAGQLQIGTLNSLNSAGGLGIYSNSSPYISFHDNTTSRTAFFQEWQGRFYAGEVSYSESEGSYRSPLFYDSNNTGYYLDPASNSALNDVAIWNNKFAYLRTWSGSYGNAGQVLTSGGSGSASSWQDAGGGAWEVIGNYTGQNVNSLDFVHNSNNFVFDNTTYKHIKMYAMFNPYTSSSASTLSLYPLVGSTSSYTALGNLAFFHQHWKEMYPEFSGVSYGAYQWGYNAQYANNNTGVIVGNIKMDQTINATYAGSGMFSETIGGTSYHTGNRFYTTNMELDIPCKGIASNHGMSGYSRIWYDDPSMFAYERHHTWQVLGRGFGKVGLRFIASSSSARWDYDITFIGLKP